MIITITVFFILAWVYARAKSGGYSLNFIMKNISYLDIHFLVTTILVIGSLFICSVRAVRICTTGFYRYGEVRRARNFLSMKDVYKYTVQGNVLDVKLSIRKDLASFTFDEREPGGRPRYVYDIIYSFKINNERIVSRLKIRWSPPEYLPSGQAYLKWGTNETVMFIPSENDNIDIVYNPVNPAKNMPVSWMHFLYDTYRTPQFPFILRLMLLILLVASPIMLLCIWYARYCEWRHWTDLLDLFVDD